MTFCDTISGKKYHLFSVILKELAFWDSSANVLAALAFNCRNVASCFLIKYVPAPSMFVLNWLQDFVKFADYIIWWQNMRANIGRYLVDVPRGQPIKLNQVVSTSELHGYWWNNLIYFNCSLGFLHGLRSTNIK